MSKHTDRIYAAYMEREHPAMRGGVQRFYEFANGYGASVIRTPFSYGGDEDLWELAVLDGGGVTYDTPITDKVVGDLSDNDVEKLLASIAALPLADNPRGKVRR